MADSLLGFHIEGAGLDALTYPGGLMLHADFWPQPSGDDRQWLPVLSERPQSVETRVNPYTGEWQVSSYTLEVSRSDRMMALFFTEQRYPDGTLSSFAGAGVTDIDYDQVGRDGTVIWIDDEAILLGFYSGGQYVDCTRGVHGTRPQYHAPGAFVFEDATPYWESRLVTLHSYDVQTQEDTVRWQGVVRDIYTSEDGSRIIIELEEMLGVISRAQVNLGSENLVSVMTSSTRVSDSGKSVSVELASRRHVSQAPQGYFDVDGEAVYGLTWSQERQRFEGAVGGFGLYGSYAEASVPKAIYEVCVLESFIQLALPRHPLALSLALLVSDGGAQGTGIEAYKVLTDRWGLALDFLDFASWQAAIEASPGLAIDQLVLGMGGEPVDVLAVIQQKLLRPFGYYLTLTQQGFIGVARLRLLDVRDVQASLGNLTTIYPDGPLQWMRAFGSTSQRVVAEVGGLPWREGKKVTIREPARSGRRALLGDTRDTRIDYSVIAQERLQVSGREDSELANALTNLLALSLDAVPRIRVRVPDTRESATLGTLDMGAVVRLESLEVEGGWAVNRGKVVSDLDDVSFFGQVIGRTWDTADHSYTLELLLTNYTAKNYIRLRAPSTRVTSYSSETLTVTTPFAWYSGGPTLETRFTPKDEVVICSRQGVQLSQAVEVASVGPQTLSFDTAPSVTPTSQHVIRLAASEEYSNDTRYGVTIRPFAFLSEAGASFDDGEGEDTGPDLYGTQVYGGAS